MSFGNVIKAAGRHMKSTSAGLASIGIGAFAVYRDPLVLADPVQGPLVVGLIMNGAGNVFAGDATKSQTNTDKIAALEAQLAELKKQ